MMMLCCCTSTTSDSDSDSSKKCRKQSPSKEADKDPVISANDNDRENSIPRSDKDNKETNSETPVKASSKNENEDEVVDIKNKISETNEVVNVEPLESMCKSKIQEEIMTSESADKIEMNITRDSDSKNTNINETNEELSICPEQVQVTETEIKEGKQDQVYAEGPTKGEITTSQEITVKCEGPAVGKTALRQLEQDYIASESTEELDEMSQEALTSVVKRLEQVTTRLENLTCIAPSSGSTSEPEALSAFVKAFDDLLNGDVANFLTVSNKIGGDLATLSTKVSEAFQEVRNYLVIASKSKKPTDDSIIEKLLEPFSKVMVDIQDFKDANRKSPYFNHLSAVATAIGALGWITVSPKPGRFCKEMVDSGTFYTNRVLKDYKDNEQIHVDWVKYWNQIWSTMVDYIKEHHTTGLTWNKQGGDASAVSAATSSAPAPPPPPPPPAVLPPTDGQASNDTGNDAKAALFADLNKGTDITKGLKRVTDDMKTHKNPDLRLQGLKKVSDSMKTHKNPALRQGPAPFKATVGPPKVAPKPASKASPPKPADKPPLTQLLQNRWRVEHHNDNHNIVIDNTEWKHTVYIFKCTKSTIVVKGKINSITLDSCKKVAVAFDDLVSTLEFVNCQSVQGQVMGALPTVSIDKTDGCQVYLSEKSLSTEIITAKSSEMNICVPKGDGEFTEYALPEQFKTTYDGKKMVTVCTDI